MKKEMRTIQFFSDVPQKGNFWRRLIYDVVKMLPDDAQK